MLFAGKVVKNIVLRLRRGFVLNKRCRLYAVRAEKLENEIAEKVIKAMPFEDIPGPKSHWFFGTLPKYLPFFGEYSLDVLHKNAWLNYTRYGQLVRERVTPTKTVLHVFAPRDVEAVLRGEGRLPERRSHLALLHYRTSKPSVYNTGGLLATNGPEWWRLRSTFQKNFSSPQSVKNYVEGTDHIAQEFVGWVIQAKTQSGIEDFLPFLNRLFLETIGYVAFDIRLSSFSQEEQKPESLTSRLIHAAYESNSGILKLDHGFLWRYIKTPLYRKMSSSQTYLEQFASSLLVSKLKFFESVKNEVFERDKSPSLLDMFLLQPGVDERDLLGMMVDILMAAVDTTSYSSSFLLYYLSRCARSQDSLFEECVQLLPARTSPVTAAVLARAQYARACVRESLRLSPVSIGVGRVLQKDIVLSGYHVPKGTIIVTQNMVASRLHQYCKDPLSFKPERWLKSSDQHEDIHPFLSLPFGFGPRSCIARRLAEQTMCIALLKMVRNFKLEWRGGEMDVKTLLINKPDAPVDIKITSRNI